MKRIMIAVALLFVIAFAKAQQPVLVSAQLLNENIKDPNLVILFTGFITKADYDREHIEGSRFLWPEWLRLGKSLLEPFGKISAIFLQLTAA